MKPILFFFILSFYSCMNNYDKIDLQGHRGSRGLLPENTVPGFLKACELGVNTIELDVVISVDGQVVVSHEAFFNHEISTSPFEVPITAENEKEFRIYDMITPTVQRFDVGMRVHPRFPDQKKIPATKPLLREVVNAVKGSGYDPYYNIEIKRTPEGDGIYHPNAITFANVVLKAVKDLEISDKTTIQCFDHEVLQYVHSMEPELRTVMLVEDDNALEWHLEKLGYIPYGYSPDFHLVDDALIEACHQKDMKIIPWTVNEEVDIIRIAKMGVDGIISDYPDRLVKLLR